MFFRFMTPVGTQRDGLYLPTNQSTQGGLHLGVWKRWLRKLDGTRNSAWLSYYHLHWQQQDDGKYLTTCSSSSSVCSYISLSTRHLFKISLPGGLCCGITRHSTPKGGIGFGWGWPTKGGFPWKCPFFGDHVPGGGGATPLPAPEPGPVCLYPAGRHS